MKSKHLLLKDKFGYKAPPDIPISPAWYINQWFLNFSQHLASGAGYKFFARSAFKQHRLLSSMNFAMYKIKPGALTAGTVKRTFKQTVEEPYSEKNKLHY